MRKAYSQNPERGVLFHHVCVRLLGKSSKGLPRAYQSAQYLILGGKRWEIGKNKRRKK